MENILNTYNIIDIIIAIFLAIGLIQGIRRGLSGELARLIGIIVAVWAGWHFYHPLGNRLLQSTRLGEQEAYAAAFFICLAGIVLIMVILRLILRKIMEITFKGGFVERVGGACAGLLRSALICAAILFFLNLLPSDYIRQKVSQDSIAGRLVSTQLPKAYHTMRSWIPGLPPLPQQSDGTTDAYAPADTPEDSYSYEDIEVPAPVFTEQP